MTIHQEKKFKPITITLESVEEIIALWDAIEGRKPEEAQKAILVRLCHWLSHHASL